MKLQVPVGSGPKVSVRADQEQVEVRQGGRTVSKPRVDDPTAVHTFLGFSEPVISHGSTLQIGSRRIELPSLDASPRDSMHLSGFSRLLGQLAEGHLRVATKNEGKIADFAHALKDTGLRLQGVQDLPYEVVEDGHTFEDNAMIKAQAWMLLTGGPVLVDDSGICIDALGGKPGIHSRRYSGIDGPGRDAANNGKILRELEGVPLERRTAQIVSVLAHAVPGKAPVLYRREVPGHVLATPKGQGGFGSDSLFRPLGETRTLAEMSKRERLDRNPRTLALQAFLNDWTNAQKVTS